MSKPGRPPMARERQMLAGYAKRVDVDGRFARPAKGGSAQATMRLRDKGYLIIADSGDNLVTVTVLPHALALVAKMQREAAAVASQISMFEQEKTACTSAIPKITHHPASSPPSSGHTSAGHSSTMS